MQSIDLSCLCRMLLLGSNRVIEHKKIINEINIFPIPDSDTGNNLAKTFCAIKEKLSNHTYYNTDTFIHTVLDAALSSSQGNSGMIMVSYLNGFLSRLKGKEIFVLQDLLYASQEGAITGRNSIEHPMKGTILDVMDAFSGALKKTNGTSLEKNFEKAIGETKQALISTEKNMELLRKKHVVDAGALAFTLFVFGMYEGLSGKAIELVDIDMQPVQHMEQMSFGEFPYEIIFIVEKSPFSLSQLKQMFHSLGDSLDIVVVENKVKIHIHTNMPDVVKETAVLTGKILSVQTVDMRISSIRH